VKSQSFAGILCAAFGWQAFALPHYCALAIPHDYAGELFIIYAGELFITNSGTLPPLLGNQNVTDL
jgi:hypothetical protein